MQLVETGTVGDPRSFKRPVRVTVPRTLPTDDVLVVRKAKAGAYQARVRVGKEGRIWLSLAKVDSNERVQLLGRPALVTGWRYTSGQRVSVRADTFAAAAASA